MANKFYEIIDTSIKEIGERVYQVQTFNLNLKDFLKTHFDKQLYIYGPSIQTNQIRAIII
jgi:membrane protease subunit (stomatin/prohibitin family)